MQKAKTTASDYFSLITFSHTVFALPFAVIGFFMALKDTRLEFVPVKFFFVLLCMVFARSAAMAFNRYADRNIDALNERTASREIPKGIIAPESALIFVVINSVLFIVSAYFINMLCFYLSPVALLLVLGYSYTKRFTPLSHFVLGAGLSLAPWGAYLAVNPVFSFRPLVFSAVVLCWVSGFDIIYSLQDESFDKEHKLKSIPARFGKKNALQISRFIHLFCSGLIIVSALWLPGGLLFWIGAVIFISLLVYQHTLVQHDNLSKVNLAFFTVNGFASVIFALMVVIDLLAQG